ncbi:MAG: DUF3021 domain-containing protein [Christensenellales bacterium]|jgi:hypothetical protein
MKKSLCNKALIGFAIGTVAANVIALLMNYFNYGEWLVCVPELTESIGKTEAIFLQIFLGGIFGAVSVGGMCFFEIEEWNLLRSSVAHCGLIVGAYILIGLTLRWLLFDIRDILAAIAMIVLTYALIWLIMYASWKREIRQMNRLMEEYKKNSEKDKIQD